MHRACLHRDILNRVVATFVFGVTLVTFANTMAPTFSFWDCAEFVACGASLGVPHPPGSPLYILIARLFAAFPLDIDVAVKINFLSALSSAGAALVGYLIVQRIVRTWRPEDNSISTRSLSYIAGATGALLSAWGKTAWSNAVEAEVYGVAMLLTLVILWLAILSHQAPNSAARLRRAALALYLATLGVAAHMTVFIVAPVVIVLITLRRDTPARLWNLVLAAFVGALYLIVALSSDPGATPFSAPLALIGLVIGIHILMLTPAPRVYFVALACSVPAMIEFILHALDTEPVRDKISMTNGGLAGLSLLSMTAWGAYCTIRALQLRPGPERSQSLTVGVYAALGAIAGFVTVYARGYDTFTLLGVAVVGVLGWSLRSYLRWPLIVACVSIATVMLGFWEFVWLAPLGLVALAVYEYSVRRGHSVWLTMALMLAIYGVWFAATRKFGLSESSPFGLMIFTFGVGGVAMLWLVRRGSAQTRTAGAAILFCLLAYSANAFLPIRSAQSPLMNQGAPFRSVDAFARFLERKQYGSESMVERMFSRRGEWKNQFGAHARMGFWGHLREQFGAGKPVFAVALVLCLFGLWETCRRSPPLGVSMVAVILLSSVGLILYMNFADGTRQAIHRNAWLEVRDRDYFFTPAFMFVGLAIGLGIGAMGRALLEARATSRLRTVLVVTLALVVGGTLAGRSVTTNYPLNDRSATFIPYDFGHNILASADKDAILVTDGDNDTFPIWALQVAYRYRRDVAVLNTQLGNLDWFLSQLRDNWHVDLGWTDEDIAKLRAYRNEFGAVWTIASQTVQRALAEQERGGRPVNFALYAPNENYMFHGAPLADYLAQCGMVSSVRDTATSGRLELYTTATLIRDSFLLRGLGATNVNLDENSAGLITVYERMLLILGDEFVRSGDSAEATNVLNLAAKHFPDRPRAWERLADILSAQQDYARLDSIALLAPTDTRPKIWRTWTRGARQGGQPAEAIRALSQWRAQEPDAKEPFFALAALLIEGQRLELLTPILRDWMKRHPEDTASQRLLSRIEMDRLISDSSLQPRR